MNDLGVPPAAEGALDHHPQLLPPVAFHADRGPWRLWADELVSASREKMGFGPAKLDLKHRKTIGKP